MLQPFILLGSARTGSSLVTAALHEHPAVVMYGEIFIDPESARQAQRTWKVREPYAPDDYYRDGADPVAFLEKHVYGQAYPAAKKALGFKLFYTQMRTGPAARLWDWLAGASHIRIIHLYRKRLLEAYLSLQIARMTQEWLVPVAAGAQRAEVAPVKVDVDQFKQYADEELHHREEAERLFQEHPRLTIEYHDDVVAQFDTTVRKMEEFLGIESRPLPQKLQKQARLPISEEIANFHELYDALEGSRYEALL
jgi:LPS sulfotransferase NodH